MISLIVPTYKQLGFLELVLQGIKKQSYSDFELIIAEDDNAAETVDFLQKARAVCTFPIKHVSQADNGFRKTKILNAAVQVAQGEQLVFIDGDCIPHKHFLKEYAKAIIENRICYGRRVFLRQRFTTRLLYKQSIRNIRFYNILFSGSKPVKHAIYNPLSKNMDKQYRGIVGCNWGILRKHICAVNGFDEDYTRASVGEDTDIEWRLKAMGFLMKSMKHKALVYHLYHESNYNKDDVKLMQDLIKSKMREGHIFCFNGLIKSGIIS